MNRSNPKILAFAIILLSFMPNAALCEVVSSPEAVLEGAVKAAPDVLPPIIKSVKFDEKAYFPGDIISSAPRVTAVITDEGRIASIEVWVSSNLIYSGLPGESFEPGTGIFDHRVSGAQRLATGTYSIRIRAWDAAGNMKEARFDDLNVKPVPTRLAGPVCHPLSFAPGRGEAGEISYQISVNAEIKLLIYNSAGTLIWSRESVPGKELGRAGLVRTSWDGRDGSGKVVQNGLYDVRIVSGNRILGSGKFIISD